MSCLNDVHSVRKSLKVQYLMRLPPTWVIASIRFPDTGSDDVGLPAIPDAMLLTILEDVSDVLVDPEYPPSSQLD